MFVEVNSVQFVAPFLENVKYPAVSGMKGKRGAFTSKDAPQLAAGFPTESGAQLTGGSLG
jgi:hypothetical protein